MSIEQSIRVGFNGRKLAIAANIRDSGDELILFLHGFGCTKESFDSAFASGIFDSRFALCAFDFPGHGASESLRSEDDLLSAYAEVSRAVIERFSKKRVHFVGHSMGGAVGLLAARKLDGVGAFVSIEGNLVAEDCGLISRSIAEQSREAFQEDGYERGFLDQLRSSQDRALLAWEAWASTCDPAQLHLAAQSLVDWCDRGDLTEFYRELGQVTYVYGQHSGLPEYLLPYVDSRVRRIERSGHFPMVDNPGGFYETLAELVDQSASARGRLPMAQD
jgi:pimeloyl-ACP methyl ester carboxylesterase